MLIEFSVENFRSIKDRVTLSMLASDEEHLDLNVFEEKETGKQLLKSAVIYGANASGKSNVLKAFETMVHMIVQSHLIQVGDPIESAQPFLFEHETSKKPCSFEVQFIHLGVKYVYGFSADQLRIHQEYLYSFCNDKEILIFERGDTHNYEFSEDVAEQNQLSERTLENRLYLSTSTQWRYPKTTTVFEWFKEKVQVWVDLDKAISSQETAQMAFKDPLLKGAITEFLVGADEGISNINIEKSFFPFIVGKGPAGSYEVQVVRRVGEGDQLRTVIFPLKEESKGTQRLFDLLGPWIRALSEGQLLIIDELENSLHALLIEHLVKIFHSEKQNLFGAQLIFTTHNTNLIDETLYRRDQIWITAKKGDSSTEIYSFYDFIPAENEDLEKGYIAGRYGGVPVFRGKWEI